MTYSGAHVYRVTLTKRNNAKVVVEVVTVMGAHKAVAMAVRSECPDWMPYEVDVDDLGRAPLDDTGVVKINGDALVDRYEW